MFSRSAAPILLAILLPCALADDPQVFTVRVEVYDLDAMSVQEVGLAAQDVATVHPANVRRSLRERGDIACFEASTDGLLGKPLKVSQGEQYPFTVTTTTGSTVTTSVEYAQVQDVFEALIIRGQSGLKLAGEVRIQDAISGQRGMPPIVTSRSLELHAEVAEGTPWMGFVGGRTGEGDQLHVIFVEITLGD